MISKSKLTKAGVEVRADKGRARHTMVAQAPLTVLGQDQLRAKIQADKLISGLQAHYRGERELSATQLKAAEILLSKSMPSLASIELHEVSATDKLSEAQIMAMMQQAITNLTDAQLTSLGLRRIDVIDHG